jgi:hypothetical protein
MKWGKEVLGAVDKDTEHTDRLEDDAITARQNWRVWL